MPKPPLTLQPTTLWDYPSQNYGKKPQGDTAYRGATPSYVIWNLLMRYTREKHLVVDPMCGSGTTIDVCKHLNRRFLGYDINPARPDIFRADARELPLEDAKADFVFVDPPYGDNIRYSDQKACIGRLKAATPEYFKAMHRVIGEIHRILRPDRFMGLYVCDSFNARDGFVPIGPELFNLLKSVFTPVDIVCVVRHNRTLDMGNYRKSAVAENFFLRGFNYLFIMHKPKARKQVPKPKARRKPRS